MLNNPYYLLTMKPMTHYFQRITKGLRQNGPSIALALSVLLMVTIIVPGRPPLSENAPPPVNNWLDGEYRVYDLPVGTPLMVILHNPIHTAINQPGDTVEAAVTQDIYVGQEKIITKSARLKGSITTLEQPLIGQNAVLGFQFNQLTLANGDQHLINGVVRTGRADHRYGGELTPGTEYEKVTHRVMGIGAYNKAVLTGPRQMGHHIEFKPGDHFIVTLANPLQLVLDR